MPTPDPVHPELLAQLRRRDPEALESAVREHARPLFRAARGMGFSDQEAEDLVQDVFVSFIEGIDRFEGRSRLGTWLFGILHRKAMERRRELAAGGRTDPIDAVFESWFDPRGHWAAPPADLERLLLSKEAGELILQCLDDLPVNQREAFVLREVEGLPATEICKILDISATHYGVLMHRARIRLRECLRLKGWRKS